MTTGSAASAINPSKINVFANYSNVALADALGDIDTQLDILKGREKAAREEMTRRRLNALEGARFTVVKAVSETHSFDGKGVRTEMGDAWYEARLKPGFRTTYTVTSKPLEQLGVGA